MTLSQVLLRHPEHGDLIRQLARQGFTPAQILKGIETPAIK